MTNLPYFKRKVNPTRKDSKHWDEGVVISNLPEGYSCDDFPEDIDDYGPEHFEIEGDEHERYNK